MRRRSRKNDNNHDNVNGSDDNGSGNNRQQNSHFTSRLLWPKSWQFAQTWSCFAIAQV